MSPPPPTEPDPAAASPLVWSEDGQPRSSLYGDIYFSTTDGLAESRAVFLQGGGLPQAWADRRRFVVGELGFGTGLNILALLDLWRRERPSGGRLHIFSIEAHLMPRAEAARALAAWPEIAGLSQALLDQWPSPAHGFHRLEFPDLGAVMDLAVMEVGQALEEWTGRADAWFLDGFSPALNPAMWRQEVLDLVAARSAPGARAATFTVAGAVRRGLSEAGFSVSKLPGFGRKRERLEAILPGTPSDPSPVSVAVIGAGIAGCAAAAALKRIGGQVQLFDAAGRGDGASGNPAALVTPRLDAGLGPVARLFAQGLDRAAALYDAMDDAVIHRGVLQMAGNDRDAGRFATIAASNLFPPGEMDLLDAPSGGARMGESTQGALAMQGARVIEPSTVLARWAPDLTLAGVSSVAQDEEGRWRLLSSGGALLGVFDAVVVAAGMEARTLIEGVDLRPVRGQVTWVAGVTATPAAWGGYVAPTRDGLVFGATHDRDDIDRSVRPEDHQRNLDTLRQAFPDLAAQVQQLTLEGRAGVRATTADHLPLAGAVYGQAGLYLLSGLGSRGFAIAPLLGEHVAALVLDAPSPLPAPLAEIVDPDRFRRRAARRGHS